jgi:hypothetical protein
VKYDGYAKNSKLITFNFPFHIEGRRNTYDRPTGAGASFAALVGVVDGTV